MLKPMKTILVDARTTKGSFNDVMNTPLNLPDEVDTVRANENFSKVLQEIANKGSYNVKPIHSLWNKL